MLIAVFAGRGWMLGFLLVAGLQGGLLLLLISWWLNRKFRRRTPLTADLVRPPGHSLRERLSDLDEKLMLAFMLYFLWPLGIYSMHISDSYFSGAAESRYRTAHTVIVILFGWFLSGRYLLKKLVEIRHLRLGLDGELAVGYELDQLMLEGCRVFHDISYPYGNIDHVVVSRSGVYCINTKMRGKPPGMDNAEVVVDYTVGERGVIRFPDGTFSISKDPETEANWLSQELSKSTGSPVAVEPMLAFPGWFFKDRIGRGRVFVFNPTRPHRFLIRSAVVNTPERITQIAYQLERMVRSLEPVLKDKSRKWSSSKD
ncbi:MAG: nuclease-related domain-containing protein [Planctomycetaceae bacterium]